MCRDEVLQVLRAHQTELTSMGVHSIAVFGSCARDEAGAESDVDLLVELERPAGLFTFIKLQLRLETILGRRVDLVTPDALRPAMREQVLREAVRAT